MKLAFTRFPVFVLILAFISGCNCEECGEPAENEPYVKLRFFRKTDISSANVAIREFNGIAGAEIRQFQDTTNEFQLPLSTQDDESFIILTYADASDYEIEFVDTIHLSYVRDFEYTPKNFVQVVGNGTEVLFHTMDSLSLTCSDTLNICNSNETVLRAFF